MRGRIVVVSVLMLMLPPARAALYNANEVPVLYVPVSARATALGNSLYCSPDDAVRYNAAFLGDMTQGMFSATYGSFQHGTNFSSLSLSLKTGCIGWAAGMSDIRQHFDTYSGPDTARDGTATVAQSLFSIASGYKGGGDRYLVGTAIRILTDSVDSLSSSGYGVDVGGGYLVHPSLRAGLVIRNAVTITDTADDKIGPGFVLAGAWQPPLHLFGLEQGQQNLLSAALTKSVAPRAFVSLGWESTFYDRLAVRLGYDRDYPSLGLGFSYAPVSVDLAVAFKAPGALYFMTAGWSFGGAGTPSPAAAPAPEEPAAAAPEQKENEENDSRVTSLVENGWTALRENRTGDAEASFAAALRIDPECREALRGRTALRESKDKARVREQVQAQLSQGAAALNERNYLRAQRAYGAALELDSKNEKARAGLAATVTRAARELDEGLRSLTGDQGDFAAPADADALAIVESGTFGNLVNAVRLLNAERCRESCGEWQKVQPHQGALCERFDAAFAAALARAFDRMTARATQLAETGAYGAAAAELKSVVQTPELTADETRRIKARIASYDYVGTALAQNYIEQAEAMIRTGERAPAADCLKRALHCGYETERVQQLLRDLEAAPPPNPAADRPSRAPAAPAPGTPSPAVDPAMRQKLLAEYHRKAAALYRQNRFRECREYLRKILYIDPGDRGARTSLNRVNQILRTQGE
jgi:tetratricopeptide (TPR) repeat protein